MSGLKTTKEIERFTELYQNPNVTIDDICGIFKYAPGSIYRMAFEMGLRRPKVVKGVQLSMEQIKQFCERLSEEMPPAPALGGRMPMDDPQALDFALLLSDEHAGRITKSTNAVVFGKRMMALGERVARIINRYRKQAIIGRLSIFKLGDGVTGERIGLNVTLEELEHTILTQCYGLAIPYLVRLSEYLLINSFGLIDVYAVAGNHGVVARPQASKGANWDTVVNLGWQARMAAYKQMTFNIETVEWYTTATTKNIDWLLMHGSQVKGGNPYNQIASNLPQWHRSIPEHFDYVAMGHFHHFNKIQECFVNGTLLTDDEWSREVVKRDGECVQVLLVVSDRGIEQAIPIWLDDVTEAEQVNEL